MVLFTEQHRAYVIEYCKKLSLAVAWSVVSLFSNPAGPEILISILGLMAKDDWYFRISDLVKNSDGTDI